MAKDSPALAAFNVAPVPDGFERVRIARARGPILRFHGKMLAEKVVGSRTHTDRWLEIRLWETPAGAWVVEKLQASEARGERDFASAWVLDGPQEGRALEVMEALDWMLPARDLAKEMGWRFEEFVE